MSNESDKALFDGHLAEIERLRQTSAGAEILAALEEGLEEIGLDLLDVAKSTATVLKPVAVEALKSFAVSLVTAQVEKLGGKR